MVKLGRERRNKMQVEYCVEKEEERCKGMEECGDVGEYRL